jgi:hypothetical protein
MRFRTLLLLLACALLLQLPIILNPGYFNHDELQWASWSVGRPWDAVPWAKLDDWQIFQYRPFTFNLWMLLSRWFFATPYWMHAACVFIGSLNALLLCVWLRQLGAPAKTASIAALIWVLNPYTVQTHGWVGTLADILWVLCALIAFTAVQRISVQHWSATSKQLSAFVLALLLTLAALLCKEAALVIPAVFLISAFRAEARRTQIAALLGSCLSVSLYLILRLKVILAGAQGSSVYSLATPDPLSRWLEYLIFPGVLERSEPNALLQQLFEHREWISVVLISLLTVAVFLRSWRLGLLWIIAPFAALVPILLLPSSFSHYAYAASVAACVALALAAPNFNKFGKTVLACWLLVISFHGVQIASKLRQAGQLQSVLSADVNALRLKYPDQQLRIRAELLKHEPALTRSLFAVPSYLGVTWTDKVLPVTFDDPTATHQMRKDGHLEPWTPNAPASPSTRKRLGPE